jgi:hypothetical protein
MPWAPFKGRIVALARGTSHHNRIHRRPENEQRGSCELKGADSHDVELDGVESGGDGRRLKPGVSFALGRGTTPTPGGNAD